MIRSLPPRRALVTDASSAIGAIYAHRLAVHGYDLVLAASDPRSLDRFAGWMSEQTGSTIQTVEFCMERQPDIAALMQRLSDDHHLTILINQFAFRRPPSLALGAVEVMIALNESAPARLAYAAASAFAGRFAGSIVNIGPVANARGSVLARAGIGIRSFIRNLSHALDSELRRDGIRVQAVLPPARAAPLWELAGSHFEYFPREVMLLAENMVDQALAGLRNGEVITCPKIADRSDEVGWDSPVPARR